MRRSLLRCTSASPDESFSLFGSICNWRGRGRTIQTARSSSFYAGAVAEPPMSSDDGVFGAHAVTATSPEVIFRETAITLHSSTTNIQNALLDAATALIMFVIQNVRVSVSSTRQLNTLALLVLPVLCFIGLIGNFFVCVAIGTDRRLHNVTNYFLFSLALADLLVCCIVMPLSIVVEVRHGIWTWNFSVCLMYVYADVFLCSASIVHMSVISLDRYLGISKPLKTRNKSKTMIFIKITFVWVITVLISSPIAVIALRDPTNVLQNNSCMIFNRVYMVYGSTLSFAIPLLIMSVTYILTTNLLKKQARILSEKSTEGADGLRRTMPNHRKLGYCRTNSGSMANGYGKKPMLRYASVGEPEMERLLKITKKRSLTSANQELANERKATKVLAIVFGTFFTCWTPFFVANFTYGFCGEPCELPSWLSSAFLWLGYISSTLNPLIYTVFNKRFRQAFVRILRCQCFHSLRDPHSFYSRHTTILPDTYYTCSNAERAASRDENTNGHSTRREAAAAARSDQWISDSPSSPDTPSSSTKNRTDRAITIDGVPPSLPRPPNVIRRSMTSIEPMLTSSMVVNHSLSSDWVSNSAERKSIIATTGAFRSSGFGSAGSSRQLPHGSQYNNDNLVLHLKRLSLDDSLQYGFLAACPRDLSLVNF